MLMKGTSSRAGSTAAASGARPAGSTACAGTRRFLLQRMPLARGTRTPDQAKSAGLVCFRKFCIPEEPCSGPPPRLNPAAVHQSLC